jgi:hypothetical protein
MPLEEKKNNFREDIPEIQEENQDEESTSLPYYIPDLAQTRNERSGVLLQIQILWSAISPLPSDDSYFDM